MCTLYVFNSVVFVSVVYTYIWISHEDVCTCMYVCMLTLKRIQMVGQYACMSISATMICEVYNSMTLLFVRAVVVRPRRIEERVLEIIFQIRMDVRKAPGGKLSVLQEIYELLTIHQSIVFVEMRKDVDRIAQLMRQSGKLRTIYVCTAMFVLLCVCVYMHASILSTT